MNGVQGVSKKRNNKNGSVTLEIVVKVLQSLVITYRMV